MLIEPVTLRGLRVELEPYRDSHFDEFCNAALSAPDIFRFMPGRVASRDDVAARIANFGTANAERKSGVLFVTRLRGTGAIVGSTSMFVTDASHRRLEIGHTWLVPSAQRTFVNTEAKYLQLQHAFDVLGCVRVELKTDARNQKSRAAMARLGAIEEGTLRSHMLCWDGHRRDSVYFSIIDTEWPSVKARLEEKLK
jgi:RimJ/RimL family protein N-acetyltransferase